jgi:drug/metabolite transporter (DMT)-like permease
MQTWFHSVTIMPVTFVTALSFTTPIFATIFAIVFLKERAGWRRWSALLVSFIGVILIMKPDMGNVNWNVGFVLFSSAAMAVAGVFVKSLSRTEEPERIVFFMAMFMTPLSLPLALLNWQSVSWSVFGWLVLIAVLSTNAQLMMARAFARAEMVTLLPLDFTRLIFTSIFAYFVFGETLDGQAWVGAAIIVAASVYIAHRENRNKAKK